MGDVPSNCKILMDGSIGADGVVMGTKFLPAKEASWAEEKKKAVLDTRDGGASTVK